MFSCGFGFGDCVIIEILKYYSLMPDLSDKDQIDYVIIPFTDELLIPANKLAQSLRNQKDKTS